MKKLFISLFIIGAIAAGAYFAWSFAFPEAEKELLGSVQGNPDQNENVRNEAASNNDQDDTGQPEEADPLFTFFVFSDNEEQIDILNSIVSEGNAKKPAFLVHLGDIIDDSPTKAKFQAFAAASKKSIQPFYSIVGDNDIGTDGTLDLYNAHVEKRRYYSWDYKNAHFVALYDVGQSAFSEEELAWLKDDLKEAGQKQIYLFMHKPVLVPFAEAAGYDDYIPDERVTKFMDIIAPYSIAHIYTGHAHVYFNYTIGKIPVTITGGAGGASNVPLLYNPELPNHYTEVSVFEDSHTQKAIPISRTSQ